MSAKTAFGAGLLVGGAVVSYLAWRKSKQLARRGANMAATLHTGGSDLEAYLTSQGEDLQRELRTMAETEVERVAQQTADQYMGDVYGLTPSRIQRIQQLSTIVEGVTAPFRSLF